jgi:hypothetical protein
MRLGVPELMVIATVAFICFAILLVPMIFFLLTLQKTLTRCAPAHRALTPGLVWLLLIPIFGFVWAFIIVDAMSKSLRDEYRSRQLTVEDAPTKNLGLAWAILMACTIVPFFGTFAGLGAFVVWIIYWVKVAEYSGRIAQPPTAAAPAQ